GGDRGPGDRLVPEPGRAPGPPAGARPRVAPQGTADLDRLALDHQHRRLRAHPAAGQDHDRDAAGHRPARGVRPRPRPRRRLRPSDPPDAGRPRCARRRAPLPGAGMRINHATTLAAPIDDVWAIVTDPERVLGYMSGVTRWEVAGERATGLGARYRMLFRVGAAEVGGLVEVVEFDEPCDF